jgi:hypothetical protein
MGIVGAVYADVSIPDLTQIPQQLAEKTGLPVFACGLIVSAVCILISVVVIGMFAGKLNHAWIIETGVCFFLSGAFIAIGWIPVWIIGVICLIVAFAVVEKFSKTILGRER